jgi:hypothetical protein
VTTIAPSPTSPQNAVKLFEWCWVNRGVDEYKELFTADYVFLSAGTDSAGNQTREIQARRDDEIQTAQNMFIGSADRPPAASIRLNFDKNLVPQRDPRGAAYPDSLYKSIRTSVDLVVDIGDGTTLEVTGHALFFLVRGDTALIPDDLKALGFKKDRSRWWISRWEDETIAENLVAGGERRARPAGAYGTRVTMADLKAYWLPNAMAMALDRTASSGPTRLEPARTTTASRVRRAP